MCINTKQVNLMRNSYRGVKLQKFFSFLTVMAKLQNNDDDKFIPSVFFLFDCRHSFYLAGWMGGTVARPQTDFQGKLNLKLCIRLSGFPVVVPTFCLTSTLKTENRTFNC